MNMLSPGSKVNEVDFSAYINNASATIPGIVGVFEKGKVNKPLLVTAHNYKEILGNYVDGYLALESLDVYFKNGGQSAYAVRVTETDVNGDSEGIKSTVTLKNGPALDLVQVDATSVGTWGDNITLTVTDSAGTGSDIAVKYKGTLVETLQEVTPDNCGTFESQYIELTDIHGEEADVGLEPVTDQALSGGDDGLATFSGTTEYVGDRTLKTGIWALETTDIINLVAVPGVAEGAVASEITAFAEERKDLVGIGDLSQGNSVADAIAEAEGFGINSSYMASYYPWLKATHPATGKTVSIPPSAGVLGRIAYNDAVAKIWNAPAGFQNSANIGVLKGITGLDLNLSKPERDLLYVAKINPIADFGSEGFVIWGQKTMLSASTSLNRLNVRRLMAFVEEKTLKVSKQFTFKPSIKATWEEYKRTLNPFLQGIKDEGGFYDFKVICDESINTPTVVDNNMMKAKVYVKPTKTAEFIVTDYVITSSGVNFEEIG